MCNGVDYEALILEEDEGGDYDPPMRSVDLPDGYEDMAWEMDQAAKREYALRQV